jgi:hypothetical protein
MSNPYPRGVRRLLYVPVPESINSALERSDLHYLADYARPGWLRIHVNLATTMTGKALTRDISMKIIDALNGYRTKVRAREDTQILALLGKGLSATVTARKLKLPVNRVKRTRRSVGAER